MRLRRGKKDRQKKPEPAPQMSIRTFLLSGNWHGQSETTKRQPDYERQLADAHRTIEEQRALIDLLTSMWDRTGSGLHVPPGTRHKGGKTW